MSLFADLLAFAGDRRFLDDNQQVAQVLSGAVRAAGRNQLSVLRRQEVGRTLQAAATSLEERIEAAARLQAQFGDAEDELNIEDARRALAGQSALSQHLKDAVLQARASAEEMSRIKGLAEYAGTFTSYLDRLEHLASLTQDWKQLAATSK